MTAIRNDLNALCPECGAPLDVKNLEKRTCARCGRAALDREVCVNGHYVCDECRRKAASKVIYDTCIGSDSRNPIELALAIMNDRTVRMHDLKHHTLVASSLLTAYKNCGGELDLDAALRDADKRGAWFPGGICGLAGTCGAAASAGIFYSIITKTTPHSRETWSDCNLLVSETLGKIANINGPRCCKRNSFISILHAAEFVKERTGISVDVPERIECPFSERNEECIRGECPFFKST